MNWAAFLFEHLPRTDEDWEKAELDAEHFESCAVCEILGRNRALVIAAQEGTKAHELGIDFYHAILRKDLSQARRIYRKIEALHEA